MKCPTIIAKSIVEIITNSILRIRIYGNMGNAKRCAIEANHIHNLPILLIKYSDDLLKFYWKTERVCYVQELQDIDEYKPMFENEWTQIQKYLDSLEK